MPIYDWTCTECEAKRESVISLTGGRKPPDTVTLTCRACGADTKHKRVRFGVPAVYMGEKEHMPLVAGGRFDTMGRQKAPRLPEFDGLSKYQAAIEKATGPNATPLEMHMAARDIKPEFTKHDLAAHCSTPEYKEVRAERREIKQRNKNKQVRAELAKQGKVRSFRHTKLPGDPKI